jgi:hypothetical protein
MTRTEAVAAKQDMTPVYVPLGMGDRHFGVIRQVGGHDSGNDDLAAIQGAFELQWHHVSQIRKG